MSKTTATGLAMPMMKGAMREGMTTMTISVNSPIEILQIANYMDRTRN